MAEQVVELAPGESKEVAFEAIPHEARTYQVSVDGLTGSFAATKVPIAGRIGPGLIWHKPLTYWKTVTPGMEIPLNEEIYLGPVWVNDSAINIVGHVDLTVIYPNGTEQGLTAIQNQDEEAEPGRGKFVYFEPFISSQEGTYTVVATLSSEGQVLDSVTFTLVSVPVGVAEFAYVSEITKGSCKIGIYSASSADVDVQNVGDVAAECQLKVYANQYYNFTWKGWYDTGKVVQAIIQPGETVTFSACMFAARAYTFGYKVRFVGDPGTIESIRFTIRRYA